MYPYQTIVTIYIPEGGILIPHSIKLNKMSSIEQQTNLVKKIIRDKNFEKSQIKQALSQVQVNWIINSPILRLYQDESRGQQYQQQFYLQQNKEQFQGSPTQYSPQQQYYQQQYYQQQNKAQLQGSPTQYPPQQQYQQMKSQDQQQQEQYQKENGKVEYEEKKQEQQNQPTQQQQYQQFQQQQQQQKKYEQQFQLPQFQPQQQYQQQQHQQCYQEQQQQQNEQKIQSLSQKPQSQHQQQQQQCQKEKGKVEQCQKAKAKGNGKVEKYQQQQKQQDKSTQQQQQRQEQQQQQQQQQQFQEQMGKVEQQLQEQQDQSTQQQPQQQQHSESKEQDQKEQIYSNKSSEDLQEQNKILDFIEVNQNRQETIYQIILEINNNSSNLRSIQEQYKRYIQDYCDKNELIKEYTIKKLAVKQNLYKICEGYIQVRGDGNCFYTAFGYQFLKHLLITYQDDEFNQFIHNIKHINLRCRIEVKGFKIDDLELEKQILDEFIYQIQQLRIIEDIDERKQTLQNSFSQYELQQDGTAFLYTLSTIFLRNLSYYLVEQDDETKALIGDQQNNLLIWEMECNSNEVVIKQLAIYLKLNIILIFFQNGEFLVQQYEEINENKIILLIRPGHYNIGIKDVA